MPGTSLGTKDPKVLAHDVGQYGSISSSVHHRDGMNNKARKTVIRMSDVTAADIVCGRGYQIESYRGNQCMHRMIDALREEYLTSTKKQKAIIVNRVVHELKIDHGARFLRLIEITNNDDHDGTVQRTSNPDKGGDKTGAVDNTCFEFGLVDDKVAHDKISHAFRCKHRNRAVQSSKHLREEKKVVVADGKAKSSSGIKASYHGNSKRSAQKSAANPTETAARRSVASANHQTPQQEYSSPAVVHPQHVDSLATLRSLMSPQSQPNIPQVAISHPFQLLQQQQELDLLSSLSSARSSLLFHTLPSSSTSWTIHHNQAPLPSPSGPLAATVVAVSQAFVLQQQQLQHHQQQQQQQLQQERFVLATDPPQPSLSQAIVALVSHEHHRQQQQQLQLRQILATYLLAGATTNNNNG